MPLVLWVGLLLELGLGLQLALGLDYNMTTLTSAVVEFQELAQWSCQANQIR